RIEAITYWVLEHAILASQALNAGEHPMQMSVNLSARMVDQPGLVDRVHRIVQQHRFDPAQLTFEVTETFNMTNRELARRNLAGLRDLGFRLSIDDFGTGQASLAYLAEIPSDEIKLDKRFIQPITRSRRERQIVNAVIRLAHALGHVVVAEGVEEAETLAVLERMRCDVAQGYYIGRPMRLDDLMMVLEGKSQPIDHAI
ncbi:MAG: EAL domain-containing protein, partial [Novosphingobium sp.]